MLKANNCKAPRYKDSTFCNYSEFIHSSAQVETLLHKLYYSW